MLEEELSEGARSDLHGPLDIKFLKMPRIQRPADANVTAPREYALLAQIAPTSDSDIDAGVSGSKCN